MGGGRLLVASVALAVYPSQTSSDLPRLECVIRSAGTPKPHGKYGVAGRSLAVANGEHGLALTERVCPEYR